MDGARVDKCVAVRGAISAASVEHTLNWLGGIGAQSANRPLADCVTNRLVQLKRLLVDLNSFLILILFQSLFRI